VPPALVLRNRRAPAAEGRMRLRRIQSRGFETGQDRRRVHPPALIGPSSRTIRRSLAGTSCSPIQPEAKTVKVGGSSGWVPPLLGRRRATGLGQPSRTRRRSTAAACGRATSARLAGRREVEDESAHKMSQLTVRVATLLPNPSLERRPHEAWRPWAAQGSRRLHCPARPKGATPRGSPQLER
jgi:hypothetical protein